MENYHEGNFPFPKNSNKSSPSTKKSSPATPKKSSPATPKKTSSPPSTSTKKSSVYEEILRLRRNPRLRLRRNPLRRLQTNPLRRLQRTPRLRLRRNPLRRLQRNPPSTKKSSKSKKSAPSASKKSAPSASKKTAPPTENTKKSAPPSTMKSLPKKSLSKKSLSKKSLSKKSLSKKSSLATSKISLPATSKISLPATSKISLPATSKQSLPATSKQSLPKKSFRAKNRLKQTKVSRKSIFSIVKHHIVNNYPNLKRDVDAGKGFQMEQLNNVSKIVSRFVSKEFRNMKRLDPGLDPLKEQTRLICETIMESLPNLDFQALLLRWGRSKKTPDFVKESVHAVSAMAKQLKDKDMSIIQFLEQCRTWEIRPPNSRSTGKGVSIFFRSRKDEFDDVASRIDISIRLLYVNLGCTDQSMFQHIRKESLKYKIRQYLPTTPGHACTPKSNSHLATLAGAPIPFEQLDSFRSGRKIVWDFNECPKNSSKHPDSDTMEECSVSAEDLSDVMEESLVSSNSNSQNGADHDLVTGTHYDLVTTPTTAVNMPGSFVSRIWLTIKTLKVAYYLYICIFYDALQPDYTVPYRNRYYYKGEAMNPKERVFQFLLSSLAGQQTRSLFTKTIFHLALTFTHPSMVNTHDKLFKEVCKEGEESQLVTKIAHHANTNDVAAVIAEAFDELDENGSTNRPWKVDTSEGIVQKRGDKRTFTALRCIAFKLYMNTFDVALKDRVNAIRFPQNRISDPMKGNVVDSDPMKGNVVDSPDIAMEDPNDDGEEKEEEKEQTVPRPIQPTSEEQSRRALKFLNTRADSEPIQKSPMVTQEEGDQHTTVLEETSNKESAPGEQQQGIYANFLEKKPWSHCYPLPTETKSELLQSRTHMDSKIRSYLRIEGKANCYDLHLAPMEVYSASNLVHYEHFRETKRVSDVGKAPDLSPPGTPPVTVSNHYESYVNSIDETISVVRPTSGIFRRSKSKLKANYQHILELVMREGQIDSTRRNRNHGRSLDFGIKAELNQSEIKPYGSQHFLPTKRDKDPQIKEMRESARLSLGNILDFLWDVGQDIQKDLGRQPLGGNKRRMGLFGKRLGGLFGAQKSEFEALTVAHTPLTGTDTDCIRHRDKLNDLLKNYYKTVCLNVVLVDERNGDLHLLQFLGNFRAACRNHVMRTASTKIPQVVNNVASYKLELLQHYNEAINNSEGELPTFLNHCSDPFDISSFFLDDQLLFEKRDITNSSKGQQPIYQEILELPIGISRTLSFSGILDVYYKAGQRGMKLDQMMELCFVASFVSTPVIINEAMTRILEEGENDSNFWKRKLNEHPYYVLKEKIRELGVSLHCGISPRYASCSNRIMDGFSDRPTEESNNRLRLIGQALLKWMNFIDSYKGKEKAEDIPLKDLRERMRSTISEVREAAGLLDGKDGEKRLDFGEFRLGVFTTLTSSLNLLKMGPHLHQLFLPTKDSASADHLIDPSNNRIQASSIEASLKENRAYEENEGHPKKLPPDFFSLLCDEDMREISGQLNRDKYRRSEIEVILCESKSGRFLKKKDVFKRGQAIFRITDEGYPVMKEYGAANPWLPVFWPNKEFAFLKVQTEQV